MTGFHTATARVRVAILSLLGILIAFPAAAVLDVEDRGPVLNAGNFRMPISLGGPPDLAKVAMDAIANWRAEPARINGAPLATPVVLQVTFKTVE